MGEEEICIRDHSTKKVEVQVRAIGVIINHILHRRLVAMEGVMVKDTIVYFRGHNAVF